jgi:membrane-associated phospholipid phosphatase
MFGACARYLAPSMLRNRATAAPTGRSLPPGPPLRRRFAARLRVAAVAAAFGVSAGAPMRLGAQATGAPAAGDPPAVAPSPAVQSRGDEGWSRPGPAVTRGDAAILGAAAAAALALMTADERIARWSQRPALQNPRAVRGVAAVVRTVGDPGTLAIGGVTYAVGLARRDRAMADVGLHTVGAIVVSGVATGAVKMLAGRARPYVSRDTNARSFSLGRGLRQGNAYMSFPSGHSTAAFAFAAALSAEGRHRWPRANRVTAPLAYTAASMTALSRIYHDRHWASDVVMGAGIGIVAGRAVVRHQHARPHNAADGRLLPPRTSVSAAPFPATVAWTVRF